MPLLTKATEYILSILTEDETVKLIPQAALEQRISRLKMSLTNRILT